MNKRSLPLCIILSVITFGFFYLYWFFAVSKEIITELEYEKIDSPVLNLVYFILSLTLYQQWWNYKVSSYLATIEKNNKIETDFWSSPISLVFGLVLHQSRINRILATKVSAKSTTKRKRKASPKVLDKNEIKE